MFFKKNNLTNMAEETKQDKKSGKSSKKTVKLEEYQALQAEMDELKDKYLRLMAEFENFRKRNVRERLDLMKNAAQDTMSALLPVLDDFDRAKKSAEDEKSEEVFTEGVSLVYHKLFNSLGSLGLESFDATGDDFDPELHEAITEIPAPTEELKGKVIDTIEKGYRLNDRIIRYAKVVVGK
jgi:molecular chaperone GrpE